MIQTRLVLPFILVFALVVSGCGGKSKSSSSADTSGGKAPTATELIQKANTASKSIKFFHFKLSHENGSTPIPLGLELTSAEGDVANDEGAVVDVSGRMNVRHHVERLPHARLDGRAGTVGLTH